MFAYFLSLTVLPGIKRSFPLSWGFPSCPIRFGFVRWGRVGTLYPARAPMRFLHVIRFYYLFISHPLESSLCVFGGIVFKMVGSTSYLFLAPWSFRTAFSGASLSGWLVFVLLTWEDSALYARGLSASPAFFRGTSIELVYWSVFRLIPSAFVMFLFNFVESVTELVGASLWSFLILTGSYHLG